MSASIAELETFVVQARRVRDVAANVYAVAGEEMLKAGDGRRVVPEAWALHHTAKALAEAEVLLDNAKAEAEAEAEAEQERRERNRATALDVLQKHPDGLAKADLLNVLRGRRAARFEALSALHLAAITVEFRSGKQVFVMLNPAHANT